MHSDKGEILKSDESQIRNPKCQTGLAPRLVSQSNRNFQISDLRCRIRPISKCLSSIAESSMLIPSRGEECAQTKSFANFVHGFMERRHKQSAGIDSSVTGHYRRSRDL